MTPLFFDLFSLNSSCTQHIYTNTNLKECQKKNLIGLYWTQIPYKHTVGRGVFCFGPLESDSSKWLNLIVFHFPCLLGLFRMTSLWVNLFDLFWFEIWLIQFSLLVWFSWFVFSLVDSNSFGWISVLMWILLAFELNVIWFDSFDPVWFDYCIFG